MFSPPPSIPAVTIPEYLLHVASTYADRDVVCYLQDSAEEQPLTTSITWRQFLADVWTRTDHLLAVTGLKPRALGQKLVVVGLLAESNYDFLVDLVAMLILRWQVLLISRRNSPDAIFHLMQTTGCSALLVDGAISHLHVDILSEDPVTGATPTVVTRTPISSDSTRDGTERALIFLAESETFSAEDLENEAKRGAVYLHTSGSTGHPKAIAWSHEFLLSLCAANYRDRQRCNDDVIYTCFPMFHAGGICTSFPFFLGSGASFVCLDTWRSVSADTVLRHLRALKHHKVDVSLPPSILEDIVDSHDSDSIGLLVAQNTVFWGGAALREDAGEYLVQHGVKLVAWGGSTETGPFARSSLEENADPMDWMYMRLVDYYEFNWHPIADDVHGRYNLTVFPVHATPPVINTFDPIGFATVDGWLQHPDPNKSHLWKPAGRLDDVTVLSNGEKTDNTQLEALLCASRYIYQAIIFGTGKFVNGAIVNPPARLLKSDNDEHINEYLNLVWPHIEDNVNTIVPRHSRLLRGMILVARSNRPFLVSDKGTVKAKATLALYAEDVERAYEALELGVDTGNTMAVQDLALRAGNPDVLVSDVCAFVEALVADTVGQKLMPEDDFFRNGMDSLVATRLRASLSAAIRRAGIAGPIPRNIVYAHPTCAALSRFLITLAAAEPVANANAGEALELKIAAMIERYSEGLPHHEGTQPMPTDGDVYAVTGTTGSLGASFAAHLLTQPHVKKVYFLNRNHGARSMESRQEGAFLDKGLNLALLQEAVRVGRVTFVEFEAGKDRLNTDNEVYIKLTRELTHIVHVAWLLNFNLLLPHFEPHVAGVRSVIDLALSSSYQRPPHITFVSSIGTTARWPFPERAVPEVGLNSPEFCIPQGYSYSKYVSEQIIQHAVAQRPNLRAAIIRCGQLSGALATGAWQKTEYIPRLLRSAHTLGMVPTDVVDVRWLPVDVAADILLREIEHAASHPAPGPVRYYTLDTTRYTPWQRIVDSLVAFEPGRQLQKVSMSTFLAEVHKDSTSPAFAVVEDLDDLLISYPVPMLSVIQARRAAGSLVDCEIGEETLSRYVRYTCL